MQLLSFNHQGSIAMPSFGSSENDEQNISKSALPEVLESQSLITDWTKNKSEQQLEELIGNLLKYGVFIACSTVLIGGILYLLRYGMEPVDYHFFQGQPSVLKSPGLVVTGILSGSHSSIIIFGLLILIAIPIVRVVLSLLTFVRQRDLTYTIITLLALFGLVFSFYKAY